MTFLYIFRSMAWSEEEVPNSHLFGDFLSLEVAHDFEALSAISGCIKSQIDSVYRY